MRSMYYAIMLSLCSGSSCVSLSKEFLDIQNYTEGRAKIHFAQVSWATYRIYDELICCFHNYLMPQRPAAISKALSQKLDEGAEYIRTKYEEAQKLESFEDVLHIIFNVLDEMYAVIIKNEFKKQLNIMRLELQLDMLIKLVNNLKKVLNSYTAEVRISMN